VLSLRSATQPLYTVFTLTYSVALFLKRQCDLTWVAAQSRAQAKAARPAVAAEAQDDLAQATDPGAVLSAVVVAVAVATGRLPMTSVVSAQFTWFFPNFANFANL
jgi:hypothetical protein